MKQTQVYTQEKINKITKAARISLLKYILCAVAFAALCAAFCVLSAFDVLNAYLGCALCVFLTVPFCWGSYLFFNVYNAAPRKRYKFVRYLANCDPLKVILKFESLSEGDIYYDVLVFGGEEFRLEKDIKPDFKIGVLYEITAVEGIIISFREVDE